MREDLCFTLLCQRNMGILFGAQSLISQPAATRSSSSLCSDSAAQTSFAVLRIPYLHLLTPRPWAKPLVFAEIWLLCRKFSVCKLENKRLSDRGCSRQRNSDEMETAWLGENTFGDTFRIRLAKGKYFWRNIWNSLDRGEIHLEFPWQRRNTFSVTKHKESRMQVSVWPVFLKHLSLLPRSCRW